MIVLSFADLRRVPVLYGAHNENLKLLESLLGVSIADRGNEIRIEGSATQEAQAERVLSALWERTERGREVGLEDVRAAVRFVQEKPSGKSEDSLSSYSDPRLVLKNKKQPISPRTPVQADYVQAILDSPMVFGLGPAGTGKTFLAVAVAVQMFLEGRVERLVFCRPAVEAGENLGFLPGDLREKVDPYLRPIYDALHDMLPKDFVVRKVEEGEIEIAPLAFMRGRTLARSFVILDEAQNATPSQMKMFLTRMGENARIVITGDPTQSDLPGGVPVGLAEAIETLADIEDIRFVTLTAKDVVRHPLVSKIVDAYDRRARSRNHPST